MKTQTIQRNPLSVIVYFPSLFSLRFGVTIFKAYPTFGIIWQGERKVCTASKRKLESDRILHHYCTVYLQLLNFIYKAAHTWAAL